MNENKRVVRTAEETAGEKIRKGDGIAVTLPYYWSWYQLVFPDHAPRTGKTGILTQPERK